VLGLTDVQAATNDLHDDSLDQFTHYLLHGDAEKARGWLLSRYLQGMSIAELGDNPIYKAMTHIGTLWTSDASGIFYEHRASDICIQAINRLRTILPPAGDGPTALGGAPEHDPYLIPSALAGAVLHERGFNAVNLGAFTPIDAILASARELKPRVIWWSISSETDMRPLAADIERLADGVRSLKTRVIVGGRVGHRIPLSRLANVRIGDNMRDLTELATAEHWVGSGSTESSVL